MKPSPPLFTIDEFNNCSWGANCGPSALSAMLGIGLEDVRPHMGDFERKHYTNIRLMQHALKSLGIEYKALKELYPAHGLIRVQWGGLWTEPTASPSARLRHSHWIGAHSDGDEVWIFDVNCLCVGGWVSKEEWADEVVPWLLRLVEPHSNGLWYPTHILELKKDYV